MVMMIQGVKTSMCTPQKHHLIHGKGTWHPGNGKWSDDYKESGTGSRQTSGKSDVSSVHTWICIDSNRFDRCRPLDSGVNWIQMIQMGSGETQVRPGTSRCDPKLMILEM